MSKKIQLTINEPCHENWEDMSAVEKGRFCGSCQKQVVDFSNMSDRQMAEFFKKPSTGSVCGRFMTDQLDRPIEVPKKRIPWVKYFFTISLPAFLFSMKATAQKKPPTEKVVTTDKGKKPVEEFRTLGMVARMDDFKPDTAVKPEVLPIETIKGEISIQVPKKDTAVIPPVCDKNPGNIMGGISFVPPVEKIIQNKKDIEGIVIDEQGDVVPYVTIENGKVTETMMTDEQGHFIIKKAWLAKGRTLSFSSVGYETAVIQAGAEQYQDGKLFIQLKSGIVLEEVILLAYENLKRCSYRVGGVSTMRSDTINSPVINKTNPAVEDNNRLVIYPNPVTAGGSITLGFKNLEEGYYRMQFLTQAGQDVEQKEVWVDADARLLNINVPSVAAGSYFMILTNKKTGKKYSEKIIVQ